MKIKEIKRTSEKKGISLIVLAITIIVIIILAVAVILSIANNNPIENAKEARFKSDVKAMQEELELLKTSNYVKNNGTGYNDPTTGNQIGLSDLKSSTKYQNKFEVENGKLYFKSGNALTENEKKWANELGVEKAPITFDRVDKTEALVIGSEVTASNGEQFYVIGGDTVGTAISASTQDILLLAKYNLKEENGKLIQDKAGNSNPCAFSSIAYWSSVEGIEYPDSTTKKYPDLNDETKYGSGSDAIAKAKAYSKDVLGATGRLMTYEEAKALQTDYKAILYGQNTEKGYLNYWLGSAHSENCLWSVSSYVAPRRHRPRRRLRGPSSYRSSKVFNKCKLVNGKIICRKMAKKNVAFSTYFFLKIL